METETTEPESVVVPFAKAPLLDNLGIRIRLDELRIWPLYEYVRDQRFGSGWVSSLWCHWARPWLMPRRQAKVERAFRVARRMWQQEVLDAVLGKGSTTDK